MARVAVVGAGVSGLAAATLLAETHEVDVYEAGDRPGGRIGTAEVAGFRIDRAANGWLDDEPAMDRLLDRLGLGDRVLVARDGPRHVLLEGRMREVPTSPPRLLRSGLLPWWAILRAALEPLAPRGPEEESIAAFVRRRLGSVPLERLVAPMVSGIFAGDPERLSVGACFPRLKALEREHRSLLLGMRARRADPAAATGHRGRLVSLRGGVETLVAAMAGRLGDRLHLRQPVRALARHGPRWATWLDAGPREHDAVVLACPAWAAAPLVQPHDPEAGEALAAIPYAPVAVVGVGLPAEGWDPPGGFGVLVPRGEGFRTLGVLFTSWTFPDRAPQGGVLLRAMVGGATDPAVAELDRNELAELVLAELPGILGRRLPAPRAVHVARHPRGIPQYEVGHLERRARIRAAEERLGGLVFAGNYLEGVGVKDCARVAEAAVARLPGS